MNRILILIALLINSVYFVGATRNNYKTVIIEESDLCSPRMDSKISLRESQPGLLVTQLNLGEYHLRWQYDKHCHFVVDMKEQSRRQFGVHAVIQNLNFRYDSVNKECIDYIKFKSPDGDWTKKICGTHNTTKQAFSARSISNVGSVAPKGKMEVIIHIDKESWTYKSKVDMTIAFTLFEGRNVCGFSYTKCGIGQCILSDLFGDGIVNCPNGNDEWPSGIWIKPLTPVEIQQYSHDTNHTATTVIVLTIVLSVTCLLIYRKCRRRSSQQSHVADLENSCASSIATAEASALPSNDDKEMPPPYPTMNFV